RCSATPRSSQSSLSWALASACSCGIRSRPSSALSCISSCWSRSPTSFRWCRRRIHTSPAPLPRPSRVQTAGALPTSTPFRAAWCCSATDCSSRSAGGCSPSAATFPEAQLPDTISGAVARGGRRRGSAMILAPPLNGVARTERSRPSCFAEYIARSAAPRSPHRISGDPCALLGAIVEKENELLASKPHHCVGAAHCRAQLRGHALEHDVADGVSDAVIHGLEMIEVDEKQ